MRKESSIKDDLCIKPSMPLWQIRHYLTQPVRPRDVPYAPKFDNFGNSGSCAMCMSEFLSTTFMAMMTNGSRKEGPWSDFTLGGPSSAHGGSCLLACSEVTTDIFAEMCTLLLFPLMYLTFPLFFCASRHPIHRFILLWICASMWICALLSRVILTIKLVLEGEVALIL